jgi:hypothetical protein
MFTLNIHVQPPSYTATLPTGIPPGRYKCFIVCRPNFSAQTPVLDLQIRSGALVNCLRSDSRSWTTVALVDQIRCDGVGFMMDDPAGKQVDIRLVDAGDTEAFATAAEEFNILMTMAA